MATTNQSTLSVLVQGRDELSPQFDKLESRLIRFVGAIGAGIAAIRIGTAPIRAAVELERELANVQKTTNFSRQEIRALSADLLEMSGRIDVSAADLAKIAAAAGQQGLGREGVKGVRQFTESVARMSSVLDLSVDEAAENVGKIANIFKTPLTELESVVSTFNEVSNNSTANGEDLLDVVRRIGDAAGTLNLQESVALAATGLDFGQSPEVVGTAFAKVFNSLVEKSKDFGRLVYKNLDGATDRWLEDVQTSGFQAFKKVLEALRGLNPIEQQQTINKLFGGGRIGALLNKLVQDTSNTVLERNLASALTGEKGISALKEQSTVLNTVSAQTTILLNKLTEQGIRAGDQLLQPLIQYIRRLQDALSQPGVASFIDKLGKGLLVLLDIIDRSVTSVAALGINWENLLIPLTAFLGLKVAQAFGALLLYFTGSSKAMKDAAVAAKQKEAALKGVAGQAGATAGAVGAASARTVGAIAAEVLGYKQLYEELQKNKAARLEVAAVARSTALAQAAVASAEARRARAGSRFEDARGEAQAASTTASSARAASLASQAAYDAALLKQQNALNAKVQAAEAEHASRVAAINADFQAKKKAITATGSRAGLAALTRTHAQEIAAEEAKHKKSLAGIQAYWGTRAAAALKGARATAEAERLAYFRAAQELDSKVAVGGARAQALSGATAGVAAANALAAAQKNAARQTAATNPYLAAQAGLVGRLTGIWGALSLALTTARTVLGALVGVFLRFLSLASGLLTIVTLVYMVADAFGLMKPVIDLLRRFTDMLGLTSESERKARVEQEQATEAINKRREALASLTEEYEKARLEDGGVQLDPNRLQALAQLAGTSDSRDQRLQALGDLSKFAEAAKAIVSSETEQLKASVGKDTESLRTAYAQALARFDALRDKVQTELAATTPGSKEAAAVVKKYEAETRAATVAVGELSRKLAEQESKLTSSSEKMKQSEKDLQAIGNATKDLFTKESLEFAELNVKPILEAQKERERLTEAFNKAQQDNIRDRTEASERAVQVAEEALANQNRRVSSLRKELQELIRAAVQGREVTDGIRKSIEDTPVFLEFSLERFLALVAAVRAGVTDLSQLTGKDAGVNRRNPSSSDGTFSVKEESTARKRARAAIDLERARNDMIAGIEQERIRAAIERQDDQYKKGLISAKSYYQSLARLRDASIQEEIAQRRANISKIEFEQKRPGLKEDEKARLNVDIVREEAQIAVLEERAKNVAADIGRAYLDSTQEYADRILAITSELTQIGLITPDAVTRFQQQLSLLSAQARDATNKNLAEGRKETEKLQEQARKLEAVTFSFGIEQRQVDAAAKEFERLRSLYESLGAAGKLTSTEVNDLIAAAVRNTEVATYGALAAQQELLDQLKGTAIEGTPGYKALQDQINRSREAMTALRTEAQATAIAINQGMTDALAEALTKVEFSLRSIEDALKGFVLSVAQQLQALATKNLAQNIMRAVNPTNAEGGGGAGGFFSALLGGGSSRDGSSKSRATYVTPVEDPVEGAVQELIQEQTGWFGALIKGFTSGADSVGGVIRNVITSLLTFLGSAFSALIAATAASGSGKGLFGLLGSAFSATVAHSGGLIGDRKMLTRLIAPEAFKNAAKYHSGGVLGALGPREVPIIGLLGEEMLTEDDPRHINNLKKPRGSAGPESGGTVNVWVVTPDQMPAMGPSDVVAVVSDNISRGGSIKQLVKQVAMGAV